MSTVTFLPALQLKNLPTSDIKGAGTQKPMYLKTGGYKPRRSVWLTMRNLVNIFILLFLLSEFKLRANTTTKVSKIY